jgi:hypothetical protein
MKYHIFTVFKESSYNGINLPESPLYEKIMVMIPHETGKDLPHEREEKHSGRICFVMNDETDKMVNYSSRGFTAGSHSRRIIAAPEAE